jgi:hypothetical protein
MDGMSEWISLGASSDRVVSETAEDLGGGVTATTTVYDDGGWSQSIDVPEAIQVVLLPEQMPALHSWLESHGWELFRIPSDEDDLTTYGVRIRL